MTPPTQLELAHGTLFEFGTAAARQAAGEGRLEQWIYRYLQAGDWANIGLLEGLQKQRRWWIGPVEVELARLRRCCGPEPGMEYRVPQAGWDTHVDELSRNLTEPLAMPPLIAAYKGGELSIRDGNHRHEAMRRMGWLNCWVVIWHNSQSDYEEKCSPSSG